MDRVFKALSDANRRKILKYLKSEDRPVGDIVKQLDISQASVSHHLDVLKKANLVVVERKGQYRYYSLNTSVFDEIIGKFLNFFKKQNDKK